MMRRHVVKIPAFCTQKYIVRRHRFVKNKRIRSCHALFAEMHDTDHDDPPTPPDRVCSFGSYCMRAYTQMMDSNTNQIVREYNGFDETPSIVDKVYDVCDRDVLRFGENHSCTPPRLFFIGPVEHCDGRVNVIDLKNNTMSVIP